MELICYEDQYKEQVIILSIQNEESGIGLTLKEQPDSIYISGQRLFAVSV